MLYLRNMKPILITVFFLALGYSGFAQQEGTSDDSYGYAVIKDTDGYVNVRKTPAINAPIVGKIYNYSVVGCEFYNSNWWNIVYIRHDSHGGMHLKDMFTKQEYRYLPDGNP